MADDFWREAVALKRYRSHPMMLIGDEPQSYPSYRDIALPIIVQSVTGILGGQAVGAVLSRLPQNFPLVAPLSTDWDGCSHGHNGSAFG